MHKIPPLIINRFQFIINIYSDIINLESKTAKPLTLFRAENSSSYHGFRVKRKDGELKKVKNLYIDFLIPKLYQEWSNVKIYVQLPKHSKEILSRLWR